MGLVIFFFNAYRHTCVCLRDNIKSVLTGFGLVLFILVDEQESGTLWAEREQDALDHSRDEEETQEERPQFSVAQDRLQSKYLKPTQKLMNISTVSRVHWLTTISHGTASRDNECHYSCKYMFTNLCDEDSNYNPQLVQRAQGSS